MQVSYPLSLKVSLWLILNLLLLAGLGIGFFVVQGGLSWGALVAGPTGDRAQTLFSIISGEASAATGEARHAVLRRFGTASNAEFFLIGIDEIHLAGQPVELPAEVRERLELRGPGRGFPGGIRLRREGLWAARGTAARSGRRVGAAASPRNDRRGRH